MSPTKSHEEIQHDIPLYVGSRLPPHEVAALERHLAECGDCRELVACCEQIARKFRSDLDPNVATHPSPLELRDHARGIEGPRTVDIERHLATCQTCSLEITAWITQPRSASVVPMEAPPPSRRSLLYGAAMGIAASLLVGFIWLGAMDSNPTGDWDGTSPLLVLEDPSRGGSDLPEVRVGPGQPFVPVGVPLAIPDSLASESRLAFEVRSDADKTVWSQERSVAEVTRELTAAFVVTFLIPADVLPVGEYRLNARSASDEVSGYSVEYRFAVKR